MRQKCTLILKISVIFGALYWVFANANAGEVIKHIRSIPIPYFIAAVIFLALGQVISGMRSRYYLLHNNTYINYPFCLALYFVGMLYNLILPGGIGGDGYNVYLIVQALS